MTTRIEIQGYEPNHFQVVAERDACDDETGFNKACHLESYRLIIERNGNYGAKVSLGGRTILIESLHNLIASLQQIRNPS